MKEENVTMAGRKNKEERKLWKIVRREGREEEEIIYCSFVMQAVTHDVAKCRGS
jgi:hypothetical protein